MKKRLLLFCLFFFLGACKHQENSSGLYKYNQVLPLDVGTSWKYTVTRHDGYNSDDYMTASSTITDTVIRMDLDQDYWVATIQSVQSVEKLVKIHGTYPVNNILQPASIKNYWLIVDGNRVLRKEKNLNLSDLQTQVQVEFIFPLNVGSKWSMENAKNTPLNREVIKQGAITVPAGQFSNCFYLEGVIGGATFDDWFCPGIGIVWSKVEHQGTPSSYIKELLVYSGKQ